MKIITYEPSPGTRIETACDEAVNMAKQIGSTVRFKFNDVELTATPTTKPHSIVSEWQQESKRLSEKYRNSPQGRAAAKARTAEISRLKTQSEALLMSLSSILLSGSTDELMGWLKSFAPISDDVCVKFDTAAVAAKFEAAGFKENEGVGKKPEWFNTRNRMARYIIGQAINCLKRGMPPHPITVSFIEKYESLPII